jgi:tetrahydromethanopterin S-methyltransferase subunit G
MVVEMVPKEQLLEQRLNGLEKKVDDGFEAVDKRFERVEDRLSDTNGHLLALHRLLIRVSIGGAVAISLSLLGILAQLAVTLS